MPLEGRNLMMLVTSACGMGFALFGYDQGVMGGVITTPTFIRQFHNPDAVDQGLITGLYDLGCLVGSIATFFLSEPIGRKKSMYIGVGIQIVGTILQVTAKTIGHLIVGRIITGIGVGIMTAVVPTWQSEVSPARNRGQLLTIQAACIIFGYAVSCWISLGASYTTSSFQWTGPIALQILFSLYIAIALPFLVESPRWLANHKSIDEAVAVISRLRGKPSSDPEILQVRYEIERALEEEKSNSWLDLFKPTGEQNLRRIVLGVVGLYMQQIGGINSISYYLPVILEEYISLDLHLSHILTGVAAVQYFIFSVFPIWFIERINRRTIMIWGAIAQATIMVIASVGLALNTTSSLKMTAAMYFLFYDAFAMSYLNVPWMYAPEINSLRMRVKGGAAASASNWLFNGIVVTVTPVGLQNLGWKFYMIFVALNISFVPIVYFCYPETRGLSLEQIDHIFYRKGTSTNWLYQGVRESVRRQSTLAAPAEVCLSEHGQKEVTVAKHIEDSLQEPDIA
ncbi:hexose carrier protein [Paecilomyces variotii No. 5]|uniref:Hexose carrier protein n=1 Tax=Byssochlamys spectabilis (strain No. 5 / NBRC 109023) TaxID=1356009 RepID=V5G1J3_BYSSN|nr:hexose carrier protein [Paecilomyces variotii No. 5]